MTWYGPECLRCNLPVTDTRPGAHLCDGCQLDDDDKLARAEAARTTPSDPADGSDYWRSYLDDDDDDCDNADAPDFCKP